jgi:thiamine kinase-like enzyme
VLLPRLEWSSDAGWLVLEDLPSVLPVQDALAHAGMLAVLRRLHHELNDVELLDPFVSDWPPELTARALTALHPALAADAAPRLHEMREQALSLFNSQCVISGDPNPTNWGIRDNGDLVLFDWGRTGRGAPAIDLAITIPGLGDRAAYARVASVYLSHSAGDEKALARDIAAAKVWTVVHYLAEAAAGHIPNAAAAIERLESAVPAWLADV